MQVLWNHEKKQKNKDASICIYQGAQGQQFTSPTVLWLCGFAQ